MTGQGLAIILLPQFTSFGPILVMNILLGLGTALVYPTFLAAIAKGTRPEQRAESIGTFRLWRDLGYVFGALISGLTADALGISAAIMLVGFITIASALVIRFRMPNETSSECVEWKAIRKGLSMSGTTALVDVRSEAEFTAQLLSYAIHIPLPLLKSALPLLLTYQRVVTVCGKGGGRSAEAAELLRTSGVNAAWLCGGTLGVLEAR